MLSRSYRLSSKRDFDRLFRVGTRVRGPFANLTYGTNRIASNRVAIVVSAKVDKRATVRNRLRRRAYEEIRREMGGMKQGVDIVVRVTPDAVKASRKQWNASIVQLLKRAGLLQHKST